MHVYIYDASLGDNKNSKLLTQIETRLTDLGLNGKIARLGPLKNVNDLIRDEVKRGAKTIVAVGNDDTVKQVVSAIAQTRVPLGIIPVQKKNNSIAEMLGIPYGVEACDILSARRIENIDLGKINNYFFISHIHFNAENIHIEIEDSYSIEAKKKGLVYIVNFPINREETYEGIKINPQDGQLQIIIKSNGNKKLIFSNKESNSVFTFSKLLISGKDNTILLNGETSISSPAEIKVKPGALKVIVGKNRGF
jgi:diacylglycerol kinase family enzyme